MCPSISPDTSPKRIDRASSARVSLYERFFQRSRVANRIGLERVTALKSGFWYVCQNARGVQVGTLINNKSLNVIEDESKHRSCEVHHMTLLDVFPHPKTHGAAILQLTFVWWKTFMILQLFKGNPVPCQAEAPFLPCWPCFLTGETCTFQAWNHLQGLQVGALQGWVVDVFFAKSLVVDWLVYSTLLPPRKT